MSDSRPDWSDLEPFKVLRGAEETGGEFVRFVSTLHPAPDAQADSPLDHPRWAADNGDPHVHPNQTETFRVRAGTYKTVVGDTERTLTEGEEITLPAGTPHRHFNPSGRPARVVKEDRPARQSEQFFPAIYAYAKAGKTGADGLPPFLPFAVIQATYPGHAYVAGLPIGLQKVLFGAAAPIGRMLGYEVRP